MLIRIKLSLLNILKAMHNFLHFLVMHYIVLVYYIKFLENTLKFAVLMQ